VVSLAKQCRNRGLSFYGIGDGCTHTLEGFIDSVAATQSRVAASTQRHADADFH